MQSSESLQARPRRGLLKPAEMLTELDLHILGQLAAKRAICSAVYNHYLSLAMRDENGFDLGRNHLLLLGPTGTGKTMMVKMTAEILGVPFVHTCASTLVESGYRGRPVEEVVRSLLEQTNGKPQLAERGIIFIDEIDKIRRQDVGGGRDVSGEGVQNALLTLLEGRICDMVDNTRIPAVDTSRILFICAGAFVGLDDIVRRRLQRDQGSIGFQNFQDAHARRSEPLDQYACMHQATVEDLNAFGMIPEFIGRFSRIAALHELTLEDLRAILSKTSRFSSVHQRRQIARLHGISLEITDDALNALAERAKAMKTGARAISRLLGTALDRIEYRWPELADDRVVRVIIDRKCLLFGEEPTFIRGRREIRRRDSALRSRFSTDQPGQATRTPAAADKKKPRLQVPGWASASQEARKLWEHLEGTYSGETNILEQTVSKLVSISRTLEEFYEAAIDIDERDPDAIVNHMIRQQLGRLIHGSDQTEDEEWPLPDFLECDESNEDDLPF